MMAEENALRSDRDSPLDLGEMWKFGCPQSPVWSDDSIEEERGEDTSSVEHNVSIEVVKQHVIDLSFLGGMGGLAGGNKLPLVNRPFVPRNEGCVEGELRVPGFSLLLVLGVPKMLSGGIVTAAKPFSHRGRTLTTRKRMW